MRARHFRQHTKVFSRRRAKRSVRRSFRQLFTAPPCKGCAASRQHAANRPHRCGAAKAESDGPAKHVAGVPVPKAELANQLCEIGRAGSTRHVLNGLQFSAVEPRCHLLVVQNAAELDAKSVFKAGRTDLAPLDRAVDRLVTKFLYTMPGCTTKTIGSVRRHKLLHWDRNREVSRAWLGLNMMTEGKAGFRAFHEGSGKDREVDFVRLRRSLAEGETWSDPLIESIQPRSRTETIS